MNIIGQRVNHEQAIKLLSTGYRRVALHAHSSVSYDVPNLPDLSPKKLIEKAVRQGIYLLITDHNSLDAYDKIGWNRAKGVELTVKDKEVGHTVHVNVFQLNKKQFEELKKRNTDIISVADFCEDEGLPAMYNHPFWFVRGQEPNYTAIDDVAQLFPFIEYDFDTGNARHLSAALAARHGKPLIATSDSHAGQLITAYTIVKYDNPNVFDSISRGEHYLYCPDKTQYEAAIETLSMTHQYARLRRYSHPPSKTSRMMVRMMDRMGIPGKLFRRTTKARERMIQEASDVLRLEPLVLPYAKDV